MNVLHMEKVYYVIRAGGVAAAVRLMPYRVEPQTVSEQVGLAAEDFGGPFFTYPPFVVTPLGHRVYRWLRPTFDRVDRVHRWINLSREPLNFTLAASPIVHALYVHDLIDLLQTRYDGIHLGLPVGSEQELHDMLVRGMADVVVAPLDRDIPRKLVDCRPLVAIPLVLLVHRDSPWHEAKEFWPLGTGKHPEIKVPLLTTTAGPTVNAIFRDHLADLGLEWESHISAGTFPLITDYIAAHKHWVGLSLDIPYLTGRPTVRKLPLPNFDSLTIAAYQRKPGGQLGKLVIDALQQRAERLLKETNDWVAPVPLSGKRRSVMAGGRV